MKNTYIILITLLSVFGWGCDKDKFADLNSDPSKISEPELSYSMTKATEQMFNNDYTIWFYNNFDYIFPWSQLTTAGTGNSEDVVRMGPSSKQNLFSGLFNQTRDIQYRIDAMPEKEKAKYQALKAMTYPVQIHTAMNNTDNTGSLVYTEAALAPYTTPMLLTPIVDSQATLFDVWLKELDAAIIGLSASDQFQIYSQDVIFDGNYAKWAKFCNLLKLRIAARLVNSDRARAIGIVETVVNSSVGYMDDVNDDFIYKRDIKYYGTGEGTQPGAAGKNVIDFLVSNQDPRVRCIFDKNDFNAEIVQAFIDNGKTLPPYVEQYVNVDTEGNFSGWKAPGEPWVRYHGVPVAPDAKLNSANDIYFNQSGLYKLNVTIGEDSFEKTYSATSSYSEKITRTKVDYIYPTKPNGRLLELKNNYPQLIVILGSSAETNLFLAEFKILGASLPKTAQEYLNKGVELSVTRMDLIAKNNQLPYYAEDVVYANDVDASTKLKSGEIATLLAQPICDLSTDGLEKVYIQQYINYALAPSDLWTLVRRSGIPKKNSAYFAWEDFISSGSELTIPRRFEIGTPLESNINFANKSKAYAEQNFTTGSNDPRILNTERLWFDKENPNYGEGPKN